MLNLEPNNINEIRTTKQKCYGCGACENICPHKAIEMVFDEEGFLYPQINSVKCTNCGACKKACPSINSTDKNHIPNCYAVAASDTIRKKSSSGGVFTTLAYYFLRNEGYIAGAIWDNNGEVRHIVSNKKEDVEKMRTSKYVQSKIGNCYIEVKRILEKSQNILFSGTPCQIAGLKTFLKKEYKNLFTLEIICHGAPSPEVFKRYISEEFKNEKLISVDFRDKVQGWSHDMIITTKTNLKTTSTHLEGSAYMKAFLENLCLRPSCGQCKFNKLPRQAELTIGDFWGVWDYKPKLDDKKGTSLLLVNNDKGNELFKQCKKNFKLIKPVPLKAAINKNPNIIMPTKINKEKREKFYDLLERYSVKDSFEYCMEDKADCMILNFWHAINYGAILTCYGIQCLAEKLGFNPKVINYITTFKKDYPNSFSEKFANKYLHLTRPVNYQEDFARLNSKCNTFIVGSDQVWNPYLTKQLSDNVNHTIYLLDFVKNGNKKLSFSASFGINEFDKDFELETLYKHYLKQFDTISVREDEAVKIIQEFGIQDVTQIIDGAFLIPKETLEKMTEQYKTKEKYIACFNLPCFKNNARYEKLIGACKSYINANIKTFEFDKTTPVEEWLAFIKNSEFVITDSFHAIVFAIIFNKPFVQIKNASSQTRFESLFRTLRIEDNSFCEGDEIDYNKIFVNRDWNSVNERIQDEIKKAEKWFRFALEKETKDNSEYELQNYLLIKQYLEKLETQKNLGLIKNKTKYLCKYRLYKLAKHLTFGSLKKHCKHKLAKYTQIKNSIKNI